MRYQVRELPSTTWVVVDTITGDYVTAWFVDHDRAERFAERFNERYGRWDYREVEGTDDPHELGAILDGTFADL